MSGLSNTPVMGGHLENPGYIQVGRAPEMSFTRPGAISPQRRAGVACQSQTPPACTIQLLNFQKFCEPMVKLLVP